MKIIDKEDLDSFVADMIEKGEKEVVGVQEKGHKYAFQELKRAEDLRLDYDVTMLPPKKYFMPQREDLLEYEKDEDLSLEGVNEVVPRIIIGIHPYDLIAIEQMDRVFSDTYEDEHYLKKRKESVLIGVNMQEVSEWSFAASMGTATTDYGYDLMLTDLGDRYAIEIGSSKGSDLLERYCVDLKEAKSEDIESVEREKEKIKESFEKEFEFSPESLPWLMEQGYEKKEFWEEHAEDCYSCGSCNLVCPTCYCFDVQDISDLSLGGGKRTRKWDGCLLESFAVVASGENFREERSERYRHRYMRKGKYLYDMFGDIACVGCGRCSSHCVPDIADPTVVFNELMEEVR